MADPTASELLEGFGLRLTAARIAAGYSTRKALADDIDVDQNTYTPWERGRSYPSAKKLVLLRQLLHVTLDWLVVDDDRLLPMETYRKIQAAMPEAKAIMARRKGKKPALTAT